MNAVMGDGCTVAYRFDGDESAPIVILAHSLGANHAMWEPQIKALTARYRVLRYDLRGHGGSDVPPGSYSLDRLGRDVVELLDALGLDRVHFCGLSLGGMVGQWLGVRAPERLYSLTLANTAAHMGPPSGWDERISAVCAGGMAAIRDAVMKRWFTPAYRPQAQGIAAQIDATDPDGYCGCAAAIRDMDLRPTAPLINVPTLVIGGRQDPATPPDQAEALSTAIAGSTLELLDAAHLSNVERSDEFNVIILSFLDRHGGP